MFVNRKADTLESATPSAYSHEDTAGLSETTQVFPALWKSYLAQALERALIASQDIDSMTAGTGVGDSGADLPWSRQS